MNALQLSIVTVLAALGVSCGRPVESAAAKEVEREAAPYVASEWQPDDPELARGREIYHQTCHLCHEHGEEGAPRIGRKEAWAPRVAQGTEVLVAHAIGGFTGSEGTMPARGGEDSYSDQDITAAVKFMAAASQREEP